MRKRPMGDNIYWLGAVDWDRRLFDGLIPLPDGTSYNAYLIQGSEKTVLLDAVDPSMWAVLERQLADVPQLDYVVAHHGEQDHSGSIPRVLEKYPKAKLLTSEKGREILLDHLPISPERVVAVADGETMSLGDKTLEFVYTPWVHWPETMVTYLQEEQILFSCDFFSSHLATSHLYADEGQIYEAAKRFFAEIMMPFRSLVVKNLDKIRSYELRAIAPSHGPIYQRPEFILDAYRQWTGPEVANSALVAYTTMHGSTKDMVDHLVAELVGRGVNVEQFELTVTDLGKLACALVDAATIVIATPTVLGGAHPVAASATYLVNALRPKLQYAAVIGSYGWGGRTVEQLTGMLTNVKAEVLSPVLVKGFPREGDYQALTDLAEQIAIRHRELK